MEYFAYGSNLFSRRLRARVPNATFVAVARLGDYALRFHKQSNDGSGKCNVVPSPGEYVLGAIFDVPASEKPGLDRAEGVGHGYNEQQLVVSTIAGERRTPVAYVAEPTFIDESLRPYSWYREYVARGALEHGFPPEYVARIEAVESVPDPDRAREDRNRALFRCGAG